MYLAIALACLVGLTFSKWNLEAPLAAPPSKTMLASSKDPHLCTTFGQTEIKTLYLSLFLFWLKFL